MDVKGGSCNSDIQSERETSELRRGPWTVEEDFVLINYIANHGEGRWNSLARCAGLKRTGKSCRLRWLNYLRPDVRRGNITLQEQLVILELHSRWGNRWSKIAQHLPGRTDNEIKNYWRTRVQKHAKQLKCDVNSKQFRDTMRYLWMPRLVERIQASSSAAADTCHLNNSSAQMGPPALPPHVNPSFTPEISSTPASSDSFGMAQVSPLSHLSDYYSYVVNDPDPSHAKQVGFEEPLTSPSAYFDQNLDAQVGDHGYHAQQWTAGGDDFTDNLWNVDDIWLLQH